MSTQIRITATDQVVSALAELRQKFRFSSDAEILKLALSKFYNEEMGYDENGFSPEERSNLDAAIVEEDHFGPFEGKEVSVFLDSLKQ